VFEKFSVGRKSVGRLDNLQGKGRAEVVEAHLLWPKKAIT
jgi:hypothetical protein